MAFCSSMRRRLSFASIIPAISKAGLTLQENKLETHDLEIKLPPSHDADRDADVAPRALRCLLFSPQAVTPSQLETTIKRIHRCVALTGGQNILVVFLLSREHDTVGPKDGPDLSAEELTGVYAYSQLKVELLKHKDFPPIPVLPLATLHKLPALLQRYVSGLTTRRPRIEENKDTSMFDLLRICTIDPPMSESLAYYVTDIFKDMKELAFACTTFGETLLREVKAGDRADRAIVLSDEVSPYFSSSQSQRPSSQDPPVTSKNKLRRLIALNLDGTAKIIQFWVSDGLAE